MLRETEARVSSRMPAWASNEQLVGSCTCAGYFFIEGRAVQKLIALGRFNANEHVCGIMRRSRFRT